MLRVTLTMSFHHFQVKIFHQPDLKRRNNVGKPTTTPVACRNVKKELLLNSVSFLLIAALNT